MLAITLAFQLLIASSGSATNLYNYQYYGGVWPQEPTLDLAEQDMFGDPSGNWTDHRLAFAYFYARPNWSFDVYLDYRPYGGLSINPPANVLDASVPSGDPPPTADKREFHVGGGNGSQPQPPPAPNCGTGGPGGGSSEGDPCTVSNGNQSVVENDFVWGAISFKRYYNSARILKPYGAMDYNWSHSFSQRVLTNALTYGHQSPAPSLTAAFITIVDETTRAEFYRPVTQGVRGGAPSVFRSTATPGKVLTVTQAVGGGYTFVVYRPDGRREYFDNDGRINSILYPGDPRRSLQITYVEQTTTNTTDQAYWLTNQVFDGTGRSIQFVYEPDTSIPGSPYVRLSAITGQQLQGTQALLSLDYDTWGNVWKAHYQDGAFREYRYNENTPSAMPHNLTSIHDENGSLFLSVTYDSHGRVGSVTNGTSANAVSTSYAEDDQGGQATRGGTASASYSFQLPSQDQTFRKPIALTVAPTSGSSGNGYTEGWVYNYQDTFHCGNLSDERLCRYYDRHGVETDYAYDSLFEISRTEGVLTNEQKTTLTSYDPTLFRPTDRKVLDKAGAVLSHVSYAYASSGALTAKCEIDPAVTYVCSATGTAPTGVRRWVYTYCAGQSNTLGCPAAGWLQSTSDPRGQVTTYKYYSTNVESGCTGDPALGQCNRIGDLSTVTNPLGQVMTYNTYDYAGKLTFLLSPDAGQTTFAYDQRERLLSRKVKEFSVDGAGVVYGTTTYNYYGDGDIKTVQDPDGVLTTYTYDDAHRLTNIQDLTGSRVHFAVDSMGNRTREDTFDPDGNLRRTLSRTYDALYRLQQTFNANQVTASYGYDDQDRVSTVTDPWNQVTRRDYDGLSRLKDSIQNYISAGATTGTQNVKTSYVFDARDNLVNISDPDAFPTNYTFDGLNNLSQLQSPDTGTTQYVSYDPAGNLLSRKDARLVVSNYSYDGLGRLATVTYPSAPTLNVSLNYDQGNAITGCATSAPTGRLTSIADATGTTYYCLDLAGNVRQKKQITNGQTFVASYTYTLGHRVQSVTYPSGAIVAYSFDSVGRVVSVTYKKNAAAPIQTVLSNVTYYPFGPAFELYYGDGHKLTRTYDQNYWISSIVSTNATGLTLNYSEDDLGNIASIQGGGMSDILTYDPLYRLAEENNLRSGVTYDTTYTYNGTGDRQTQVVNTGGVRTSSLTYSYFPATHHLQKIQIQGGPLAGSRSYDNNGNTLSWPSGPTLVYDARNRAATATLGGAVYAYGINAQGARVSTVKTISGAPVATSYFVYNERGDLLGEYDASGGVVQEYVYLDSMPIGTVVNKTIYYIEPDHLGTPRAVVDPSRHVAIWLWPLPGDAFGTTTPNSDSDNDQVSFPLNLRFPGQYADAYAGLNYNYFRSYEPATGRYLQADLLAYDGSANLYSYVEDNPLYSLDRFGLEAAPNSPKPTSYPKCIKWKSFPSPCSGNCAGSCGAQQAVMKMDCIKDCKKFFEPAQFWLAICSEASSEWGRQCLTNCEMPCPKQSCNQSGE